jgi:hypothetical protein
LGSKKKVSSKEKGDVVEEIVAMMLEAPDVRVHRDVQVPASDESGRTRQFDAIVEGTFAGYPSLLAIECKSYGRNVNVKEVDAFFGQLQDVGYGPQQGVLVSASGFSDGTQSRARRLGLRVLELKGLTADRLASVVHEAAQRVVFALPALTNLSIAGEQSADPSVEESMMFFDSGGNLVGTLPDLVWLRWLHGEVPDAIGEHEVELDAWGWYRRVDGALRPVLSAGARVKVWGAVVVVPGEATGHALVDPAAGSPQKFKGKATFDLPGEHPVRLFGSEEELEAFLKEDPATVSLTVGRVRVPRLRLEHVYWPPSRRVTEKIRELEASGPPPSPDALEGIEGTDLSAAWEPVSSDYLTMMEPGGVEDDAS